MGTSIIVKTEKTNVIHTILWTQAEGMGEIFTGNHEISILAPLHQDFL